MNDSKYIGLDVHQATISAAVLDSTGKLLMESTFETKASTILQFLDGFRGSVQVTFEEGTCAAWLHDLVKSHVAKVVVCDPRKNALLKTGSKNDRIDARKLADLLRTGLLSAVYHGDHGIGMLKELARSYLALTQDATRVMNRLKALYRSRAMPCAGQRVYSQRHRGAWLAQLTEAGTMRRAEFCYEQLDALQALRQQVRRDLLGESRKHSATKLLRQIPSIGPIRAALLVAVIQTPHRFRTKRQLWAYCGLALETHESGEFQLVHSQVKRRRRHPAIRGLNGNHNHDLKNIFKGAATRAAVAAGPLREFYTALVTRGMKPHLARLTLARKIAAITLLVWKKGVRFDAEYLKPQAA